MSLLSRLRQSSLSSSGVAVLCRRFSSLLSPDSKPLSAKEKTKAALTLIKAEKNPSKIVEICKAASLTPEAHIDRVTLSVAISKLAESNNLEFVSEFIEDLKTRPDLRTERFVSHAIVLYGQAKMINHAIRTFTSCGDLGIKPTLRVLNSLIFACILAKDYKQVNRVYIEFPKMYGIEPDLDTYNWVIQAFAESGSTSSAYSVLAEMDKKGVKPNSMTFQRLMAGFYAEEKLDDVGRVADLMKKHSFLPRRSTFNVRIQSLCKLKRTAEAKALLDGMVSRGIKPNVVTYNHLIHGFCREGNLEEAKRLLRSMIQRGLKPESQTYFTLVYFLCQGKDFIDALEVAKDSIARNWVPNFTTMKSLVEGLVSNSKVTEARELVSLVKDKFATNVDTWNEIEAGFPQ